MEPVAIAATSAPAHLTTFYRGQTQSNRRQWRTVGPWSNHWPVVKSWSNRSQTVPAAPFPQPAPPCHDPAVTRTAFAGLTRWFDHQLNHDHRIVNGLTIPRPDPASTRLAFLRVWPDSLTINVDHPVVNCKAFDYPFDQDGLSAGLAARRTIISQDLDLRHSDHHFTGLRPPYRPSFHRIQTII